MDYGEIELIELHPDQPFDDSFDQKFIEIEFSTSLYPQLHYQLQNHEGIFIKNCPDFQSFINSLTKKSFIRFFNRQTSIFILKIHIINFNSINPKEIQKFIQKFEKKIFIISIENSSNENVQIYWKFQNYKIFWTQIQKEISKFVINFLASSMKINGHCGLAADFISSLSDSIETIVEVDKLLLRNLNGLNLLMAATEKSDTNAVNLFIKSGFNVNEKVNETSAVNLAWNNKHFEIVLALLMANSQFPKNFEINEASNEIKKFVDLMMEMHGLILDDNLHEIERILCQNPNLRHFYSTQNLSATAYALMNQKMEVYELLIANNVYIGPDEKLEDFLQQISDQDAKNIEEIHKKYKKNFQENHLMILTVNSFVGHDVPNADEKLSHVRKAFNYLDKLNHCTSLILQTVAASKEFQIIFDFNRKSIQHLDPTADQHFRGMFYSSRQIYIAAGDLMNPENILDVYGTLIHELCHYAMLLVYDNLCKPYYDKEVKTKNLYTKIALICFNKLDREPLVFQVFRNDPELHHAELIVRIPQMMVLYSNDEATMKQRREDFPELFRFFEQFVAFDMQNHLPNIKSTTEEKVQEFRKCSRRQTKILISLTCSLPFAIWLAVFIAMPYIEPLYGCGNLTDELKLKIFESTVEFQGINVIFGDLFGRNSVSCDFSPQEITTMLKVFDSGKFVVNYTGIYDDIEAEEKNRLLLRIKSDYMTRGGSNVTNLYDFDENLNNIDLKSKEDQICQKYNETKFRLPGLQIHQKVITRAKFYIERYLTYPHHSNTTKNSEILPFTNLTKINLLLLSDKGGSGKSTYFRHMAWKLKRRFPLKWIFYVDLKQHIHVLQDIHETDANLTTIVDFLSSKILYLTSKIEIEVFKRKFIINDAIFLWDAVDEVSPVYTDQVLRLIEIVGKLTENRQWVSSLPHLEEIISSRLGVKSHKLKDYDDIDKKEFILKFLQIEDERNKNSTKVVKEIENFSKRLSKKANSQNPASNPQILQMICQSYINNPSNGDFRNIYTLYDNHSRELFKGVYKKGQIVKKYAINMSIKGDYRKIHQYFAVTSEIFLTSMNKSAYSSKLFNFSSLEITKPPNDISDLEYLRYNFLYSVNNRTLFEHDSYKDFFIAQYVKNFIWDSQTNSPRDDEATARLEFLFYIFDKYDSICNIVGDFIHGFIEAYSDANEQFDLILKSIMKDNYSDLLVIIGKSVPKVELITKFFKNDRDTLRTIWKIDQNQTFFDYYTKKYPDDTAELKRIIHENFNLPNQNSIYKNSKNTQNKPPKIY